MARPRDQVMAEERPRHSPWLVLWTAVWVVLTVVLLAVPGRIPFGTMLIIVPLANLWWLGAQLARAARARYVLTPVRLEIHTGERPARRRGVPREDDTKRTFDLDHMERVAPAGRHALRALRQEFGVGTIPWIPTYAGGRPWVVVGRRGEPGQEPRAAAVFYPSPPFLSALAGAAHARGRRDVVLQPDTVT